MSIEEAPLTEVFGQPETWKNPYPAYREFRARSPFIAQWPVVLLDGEQRQIRTWMLLKYAQVDAALRDPATFSSQQPGAGSVAPMLVMISDDPPRHTRFRRIVSKAFTARRIAELEPWIKTVAEQLLDRIDRNATTDAVGEFTMPLPIQVIAKMLGIPGGDQAAFRRWSDSLVAFNGGDFTPAERIKNGMEMMDYFRKIAGSRREKSAGDLISAVVEAEVEGEHLEEWEILGFCTLLLVAGNETTTNLMSNMLNILVDRPETWRKFVTIVLWSKAQSRKPCATTVRCRCSLAEPPATSKSIDRKIHEGDPVGSRRRGQSQSRDVPGSRHLLTPTRSEPASRLWRGHPLLPRRAAGADGSHHHAQRDARSIRLNCARR